MSSEWTERNQKYLVACVNEIKLLLKDYIAKANHETIERGEQAIFPESNVVPPPALVTLCNLFGLSSFEKSVLVLCAGVELDAEVAQLCAKAQGNLNSAYPTFRLALAALPQAHWSAVTPASPLRRFRLIELCGSSSETVTASPLCIEERVLHYLTGIFYFERQLQGIFKPVTENALIVASHKRLVARILLVWQNAKEKISQVQLWGADESDKLIIARQVCAEMGLGLWYLPAELVPQKADNLEGLVQLWTREAALLGAGLYVSAEDVEPETQKVILRLVDTVPGPVFLGTHERWSLLNRSAVSLEVRKPEKVEQLQLWELCLGEAFHNVKDAIFELVSHFNLNSSAIETASREALLLTEGDVNLSEALWEASRVAARSGISRFAQQITSKATMDDLVLPDREKRLLREIAVHVAQRRRIYEEWGFGATSNRGLGITALFSGASGTGKTMAAEVLSNELRLDLFRIDLSTVVSKYIGETEKNLRKVFDAAEDGGLILFFDEADALFGNCSEVRDNHDRYANIEVNYLLQRMESYQGLAILAANRKSDLDSAFMRRIRFVVNFPFPSKRSRARIWKRVFPSSTPTDSLDVELLSRMRITGEQIHNIALNAEFLAAGEGVPVNMSCLKRAALVEYEKTSRIPTKNEIGDW
jgi:hypothetical protein